MANRLGPEWMAMLLSRLNEETVLTDPCLELGLNSASQGTVATVEIDQAYRLNRQMTLDEDGLGSHQSRDQSV